MKLLVALALLFGAGSARGAESAEELDLAGEEELGEEETRPRHESGARFGLSLLGAKALGSTGRAVAPGIGGGMWMGYEAVVGPTGIVPRLSFQYIRYLTGESQSEGLTVETNASTITLFPGMALTVRAPARPWVGFGFGYGRVRVHDEAGGFAGTSRDTGFGVGVQGGIEFRVSEETLLGLAGDWTRVFTQPRSTSWTTWGFSATFLL